MSEQDKENKIVSDEERENATSVQEELSVAANDADGAQVEGFPLGGSCPEGTDEGKEWEWFLCLTPHPSPLATPVSAAQ